jgi:hypothetical protein
MYPENSMNCIEGPEHKSRKALSQLHGNSVTPSIIADSLSKIITDGGFNYA